MTAVIARVASRAASNRMPPARPDQLPLLHPPWPGPPSAQRPGGPASASPSRGPILVVTTGIAAAFYLGYRNLASEGLRAWVT